jgi:hypothetical protein
MEDVSRRNLIKGAGVGVAAAGAAVALGPLTRADAATDKAEPVAFDQPVIARVRDLTNGEVEIFTGNREVSVTDRDLARRIAKAARS